MDRDFCRMTGLTKAFGDDLVLRGLDLDLPAGQVTALMGANGPGNLPQFAHADVAMTEWMPLPPR